MKISVAIRPLMSLLFALLLSLGSVVSTYAVQETRSTLALELSEAGDSQDEDRGGQQHWVKAQSFHAVVNGTIQLIAPAVLPSPPLLNQAPQAEVVFHVPSLCTPALLEYYCNLRQYYIAPQAP